MLSRTELKKWVTYNPISGVFRKNHNKGRGKKGSIIGSINKGHGYLLIKVKGEIYLAHRLVWLYVYGHLPTGGLDHVNHNKLDNRICNLRSVTQKDNNRNASLSKTNTSGVCGVSYRKDRGVFEAYIRVDGILKHLGRFKELADAVIARKNAESFFNFHPNHGK